ncbi:MAG: hypothetical protein COB89_05485, partial [Piscirickettsiaceae bacterium]
AAAPDQPVEKIEQDVAETAKTETNDDEVEPDFVDQNALSRVPDDPGPTTENADTDKRFRLF